MTDEQHLEWLKKRLAEYESELAKAKEVQGRLGPRATRLREVIKDVESEMHGDGSPPSGMSTDQLSLQSKASADEFPVPTEELHKLVCRPGYRGITKREAYMRVLRTERRAFYAGDIARIVYDIRSRKEFVRAKDNVASVLGRESRRPGSEVKMLGGNNFALKHVTESASELSLPTQVVQPPFVETPYTAPNVNQQVVFGERSDDDNPHDHSLGRRPLQPGSNKYKCYMVLKERGVFMSSQELAEALRETAEPINYSGHASIPEFLGSLLRKSMARGEALFIRNEERKFGLLEWGKQVGVSPPY